jgi:hypothetical protein
MGDSIQPPPLKARVFRFAWLLSIGAAVAAASEWLFKPWFHHYMIDGSRAQTIDRLHTTFLALSGFLWVAAAIGFWQVLRIAKHGQWPLPGAFVFKETPIQRGRWLKVRLVGLLLWSILAMALGIYAAMLPGRMFGT